MFQRKEWIWGSEFTRDGFPMKELGAYTAWRERITKSLTVRKAVDVEQNAWT